MLTGTPLDLTPFGVFVDALGIVYWALAAVCLWLALRGNKPRRRKLIWAAVVVVAFGIGPVLNLWTGYRVRVAVREAATLFEQRCQSAGEKVHRTVDGVEGVVWLKWRDKAINFGEQFKLDDPYGRDCGGEECILQLLRVTRDIDKNPEGASKHRGRYRFVETIDPADGRRYRYFAAMRLVPSWTAEAVAKHKAETGQDPPSFSHVPTLEREAIEAYSARYGITWDDISTQEDREHWIAGGRLRVIDLQTNEVIAERIGYMMDRGLGSTAGFRSPWGFAHDDSCPEPRRAQDGRAIRDYKTLPFSVKVLRPNQGGN